MGSCVCKLSCDERVIHKFPQEDQIINEILIEEKGQLQIKSDDDQSKVEQVEESPQFIKTTQSKEYQVVVNEAMDQSKYVESQLKIIPEMLVRKQCGNEKFMAHYEIIKKLGQGGFGIVYLVRHITTKMIRAAKVVQRVTINNEGKLLEETEILKQLDHPNIVKILEIFADFKFFYIITEYCEGGELLERIRTLTYYNEKLTASYMQQILSAIMYCHKLQIVHRDLKPENILFDSTEQNANLKIIDFGASEKMIDNKYLTKRIGTPYYVAPEVIVGKGYDEKVDVWSCGVILYILLSGRPPFKGINEQETLKLARTGILTFPSKYAILMKGERWQNISKEAKELIKKMIVVDPKQRISIEEAYHHVWFKQMQHEKSLQLDNTLMLRLRQFSGVNKLKQAIYQFISVQIIQKKEQKTLLESFKLLDTDGDGVLSEEELIQGLILAGEDECRCRVMVKEIMSQIDLNQSGKVDFTEFLSAALILEEKMSLEQINTAFRLFDIDGNGYISKDELEEVFGGIEIEQNIWNEILQVCDENKDGVIQEKEFVNFLSNIKL